MPTKKLPTIVRTPGVCGEQYRIDGTRITVALLVEMWDEGMSDNDVLYAYPHLTAKQLAAARRFADERHMWPRDKQGKPEKVRTWTATWWVSGDDCEHTHTVKAATEAEARQKFEEWLGAVSEKHLEYWELDGEKSVIHVTPDDAGFIVATGPIYTALRERREAAEKLVKDAEERALYEELKKKYEGGTND